MERCCRAMQRHGGTTLDALVLYAYSHLPDQGPKMAKFRRLCALRRQTRTGKKAWHGLGGGAMTIRQGVLLAPVFEICRSGLGPSCAVLCAAPLWVHKQSKSKRGQRGSGADSQMGQDAKNNARSDSLDTPARLHACTPATPLRALRSRLSRRIRGMLRPVLPCSTHNKTVKPQVPDGRQALCR